MDRRSGHDGVVGDALALAPPAEVGEPASVGPDAAPLVVTEAHAIRLRNLGWRTDRRIPDWVEPEYVGLDQFFTRPEIARECYRSLLHWMKRDGADEANYRFIEPAAGTGAFYDLLPPGRRTGIDIMPFRDEYTRMDFLAWHPTRDGYRQAVVGNPPFGYRAWLALTFVNHAATFADYVGLILPMAFQSDGKGSPKHRVEGLRLVHTEHLPQDSFVDAQGNLRKINALWQVWQRGVNNARNAATCDQWLDLFTVDNRKERLCGQERMGEADYFLQRTFYHDPPSLVRDFSNVRYVCGYGIILKRDREKILDVLQKADWKEYSNLAAHNCRHISMYHIRKVLTDAGFIDE